MGGPGGLRSVGLQRVGYEQLTHTHTHMRALKYDNYRCYITEGKVKGIKS